MEKISDKILTAALYLLCGNIVILTVLFYLIPLNRITYFIVFMAVAAAVIAWFKRQKVQELVISLPKLENVYLAFGYYCSILAMFYLIFQARTIEITGSPWQVIPGKFFLLLPIAIIFLIALNSKSTSQWSFLNNGIFLFLAVSVGNLVYPLGFGYDTFIHQATEKLLLETGTISPKPFYYVGYYVTVIMGYVIAALPLESVHRWLPAMMAAIFIPWSTSRGLKSQLQMTDGKALNTSLLIFLLPITLLTAATPQALALTLTITAIFLSLGFKDGNGKSWLANHLIVIALTAAVIFIHPLNAIPLIIFLKLKYGFLKFRNLSAKFRFLLIAVFSIIASFSYLILFWLLNFFSPNQSEFAWRGLSAVKALLLPLPFTNQYEFPLDLAYGFFNALPLLIIAFSVFLIWQMIRSRVYAMLPYFLTAGILIANAKMMLFFLSVGNIIGYEQTDFAQRVYSLGLLFLLPPIMIEVAGWKFSDNSRKIFAVIFICAITAGGIYLSYPRQDDFQNSSFQNLSQYDVAIVQAVEESYADRPYLVLANQMTSAAAVRQFGFDRNITFNGQTVYFYPIPTGGPLYQYYLRILSEPDPLPIINELRDKTGIQSIIVTVSSNWKNFESINKKLQKNSTSNIEVDGKIFGYGF